MTARTLRAGPTRVDAVLARLTMYRLVTVVLSLLVVVYSIFTATGVIAGLSTAGNLAALAVVIVASIVSNRVIALAWRVRPHDESAVITALLLFFLFVPLPGEAFDGASLAWFAAAAGLANLSKYALAWRGRHVLNPAAAGALLVVLVQWVLGVESTINPLWQTAATQALLPFVAVGALLVLWRTRRLDVGLAFAVPAIVLVVLGLVGGSQMPLGSSLQMALSSFPIVFIAGFMLSEPLTLPPRRWQQLLVAGVVAVLIALPTLSVLLGITLPTLGPLSLTPEVALLLGNAFAFALAPRTGIRLEVVAARPLGGDVHEVTFAPRRRVGFRAGQYLELQVPHRSDGRGVRRVFSISSAPAASDLTVALRVPEQSSSFKRELLALAPGTRLSATGVHGDFVWPRGDSPLLLVAGGIGVTPFLSQLRQDVRRDVVLVYGVPDADDVPYRDELVSTGVPVVLVAPTAPTSLPEGWTYVEAPFLTGDLVAAAVPDAAGRIAFVSGPPAMVDALRASLRVRCRRVRTDHFTGY